MLSYIFSAVLGVFAEKLISFTNKKDRTIVAIVLVFFLTFSSLFYWSLGKMTEPPAIYNTIQAWFNGFENNIIAQIILIIITMLGSFILDRKKEGMLSSGMYSKKIRDFTEHADEGSTVSIMAGDMNYFGRIEIKTTDNGSFNGGSSSLQLMDENEEYKQLLRKRDDIELQILCKHGLETEQLKSVINGTMSYKHLYTRERQNGNLNDNTFQQLLRIGKIKKDFGGSVEILFYNSDSEDIQLRGRLIDKRGIIYQKEKEQNRFLPKRIEKFPFFILKKQRETLYSVKYLNEQEFKNYNDLFFLKWNNCNRENSEKIVTFCEHLYNYINEQEIRYHMALVYVNSYEIARKKEKRKEFPPFGVLYLAACVDELPGWKAKLIAVDEHTKPSELKEWAKYDVIGASIISSYSYGILKRCFNASKKKKDVVILAGGYQAEKFSNEVFRDFNANIIFKGEGEDSIRDFCRHYPNGDYSEISGIIYRNDISNQIRSTRGRGCVDIDKIPEPARGLLDTNDVVMTNRLAGTDLRMVHMLFSRGCPYDCYYCAANQNGNNKRIRYRDKIKIVQELEDLKNIYNIQGFSIIDDCFLTCEEKAIEICEYLTESGIDLKWSLAARVDNINDNVLNALKKAGCIEIKFGVETGSDELLKKMHKGDNVTVACAENAIRKTKKYGIGVKLFMITGLPGESDITHTETKNFLQKMYDEKLVDRVSLLRYTPLAGSHIYDYPDDFAVDKRKLNIGTFEKTRLYKESFDWWIEKDRIKKCNQWYEEMQSFIEKLWGDK